MDIRQEVRSFIESKAIFNKEKLSFGDDDNFFELRIVSSLFAMQLVMHLEKTFNLTLEDDDLDISNFGSINSIVRFIEQKKPGHAAAS